MKINQVVHYAVVFALSALAAGLYFSPKHTSSSRLSEINLPQLVRLNMNQSTLLTGLKQNKTTELTDQIKSVILSHQIAFKQFVSPVYTSTNSNYLLTFIETTNSTKDALDVHYVLIKKNQDNYQVATTLKVTEITSKKINLSYGSVEFLNQDEFNQHAMQLAQTLDLNEL